jgi:hypothetical protein
MQDLENHYVTRLQGIRRQGGTAQVYANIPLPLASALDLESGETVTWKVLDRRNRNSSDPKVATTRSG